jgi:hypothetical protein
VPIPKRSEDPASDIKTRIDGAVWKRLTPTRPDREDSNSEMSSQIIPLKARADFPDPRRISATETIRVWAAAPGTQLGAGFCRDLQQVLCKDVGHRSASPRRHELAAISFDQKIDLPAAKPATPI